VNNQIIYFNQRTPTESADQYILLNSLNQFKTLWHEYYITFVLSTHS